jgi:hypothetical protein
MPLLIVILIVAWAAFGEPTTDVAKWLYPSEPAPWEPVTSFYYPNRNDLSVFQQSVELASLDECRNWIYGQAALQGDPALLKGDYECAVGHRTDFHGMGVYRLTVR